MNSAAPHPHVVRRRRHTLYFLEWAARQRPVHLDTEVDMTRIQAHRTAARAGDTRYSVVSYLLYAAGRTLARHPEANAVLAPGRPSLLRAPRITRFESVTAKLALDRTMDGERTVLSALLHGLEDASLAEIQRGVDRYRGEQAVELPEFKGVRMLGRLPVPLGRAAFAAVLRDPRRRPGIFGTVSVSSLGHSAVDGFHSAGGTAITLTAGRILDRPVVRDGRIEPAPVMRLGLTFDHRVIDGATAADVLSDLRDTMEDFDDGSREGVPGPGLRGADRDHRTARGLEQSPA
ncbi:2-oxo acid dehydrogenase subunit E2 [Streptomyces yaanensis]|uniref:2-oxo acid dehydrogenase subunit E2 n=1 Tax=Streptomyces yaanensis TaxID=1142239 RepID=A0ABV7SH27_9ACTN|nr:2-oxo acid dehydrogenase subunit E2 [Streptomyces sp. CGMCC 4.7035]WNB99343.1 2-oxo acid dehydrogenase subunit E2 [Streptomyces sp. CGMCC 4.7035]